MVLFTQIKTQIMCFLFKLTFYFLFKKKSLISNVQMSLYQFLKTILKWFLDMCVAHAIRFQRELKCQFVFLN